MGLTVFVTRELYPFTAGGIGRVVANILATTPAEQRAHMAVLYIGDNVSADSFSSVYPDVAFLAFASPDYQLCDDQGRRYAPMHSYSNTVLHWESTLVLQGLRKLQQLHGKLDYVEFIDWGAGAFACTQEKLLGSDFAETVLAVRLHTTDSILCDFEPRAPSVHGLCLYDLERKALADCDLIVAQLSTVSRAFQCFYGFDPIEWDKRVCLHAPPVLLDHLEPVSRSVELGVETPLVFSSKLQDIKRPDIFVRGCVQFMRSAPKYNGKIVFLAHSFDANYREAIISLIPQDLKDRVSFRAGVSGAAREQAIGESVCIFPSPWESFCLAAYEASLAGAVCVLNERNPAFGAGTPWVDGRNCAKFDGTAGGLASALLHIFSDSGAAERVPVEVPDDAKPWMFRYSEPPARRGVLPSLSVVILNQDGGSNLLATVDSVLGSNAAISKIVVVDDASSDPTSPDALHALAGLGDGITVVRQVMRSGGAVARNAAIELIESDTVFFIRSGEFVSAGFLSRGLHCLANHSRCDAVTAQYGVASNLPSAVDRNANFDLYSIFCGEARLGGLYENRFGPESFMVRTAVARTLRFDEALPVSEGWEFLLRLCQSGSAIVVSSAVEIASYPMPPMTNGVASPSDAYVQAYRRLMHSKQINIGSSLVVPAYAIGVQGGGGSGMIIIGSDVASQQLRELRESEAVRYALACARFLQRRAPWSLGFGKWLARRTLGFRARLGRRAI
ncbi:glycosyltransferase [Xanthomonas sacchari]|uniref:glycosyltransferase n=1 Tax=Xanthomonas sacchari TaxID=56458 RepID=UPI00225A401A|nr:glycosyltransferase [Xanthomonas sacchari]MCW0453130.1 hypothetical protein [Xanthomonas sacchari]